MSFSLNAFQPPQRPTDKMQISPQQFQEEAKQGSSSYLSLLPADVARITKQYAYQGLENAITILREKYLADPAARDAFLNNQLNAAIIIDYLAQRFPEYDKNRFLIAVMLNTPASFGLALNLSENIIDHAKRQENIKRLYTRFFNTIHDTENILQRYLQNAGINYQQAISYLQDFLSRLYFWKNEIAICFDDKDFSYTLNLIRYAALATIIDRFESELAAEGQMSELRVILDSAASVGDLLLASEQDLTKNLLIQRYVKKNNYWSKANGIKAFKKQLIQAWRALLLDAFRSANDEKIVKLLRAVYNQLESPSPYFKEYFLTHIISPLTDYFLRLPSNVLTQRYQDIQWLFHYERELGDLISIEVIKKATNAEQIITWLNYIDLPLNFTMPTDMELEEVRWLRDFPFLKWMPDMAGVNSCPIRPLTPEEKFERAEKIKNRSVRFLLAVVQSPFANAQALENLIARGADINGADEQGVTILMHAIKNQRFDMANALLNNANINVNTCDNIGHNVLSYAQFLPASQEKDILIATLKERGAKEPGICVIQ